MKIFSAKKNPDLSPREAAQGCLTANLAVPGLGSFLVGRKVGLVQMAIYFAGFALTLTFGLRMIYWVLSHWSAFYAEFNSPGADVLSAMSDLWHRSRWALLGIGLFLISWIWALATSRTVMAEANIKKDIAKPAPL
jgi:hypothetical protein